MKEEISSILHLMHRATTTMEEEKKKEILRTNSRARGTRTRTDATNDTMTKLIDEYNSISNIDEQESKSE